jgi:thioesterase domain-containing protein
MSETTPPRTNLERELVRIWEQVFQRAPIGIRENFFDLGGTSVQAAGIFARIDETFHKRMPLSRILGAPTIEQLAALLDPCNSRDQKAFLLPVQSGGEKPIVFCIGGGHGWRVVSKYLGPDQPVFNIDLDPAAVEHMKGPRPIEKLARHVVSAICEKQPQGPYYLCGYCQGGLFAYEAARQLIMYGHEVGLLALVETQNPSPHFKVRIENGIRRNAMRFAFQVDQLYQLIRKGEISRYVRARLLQMKRLTLRMSSIVSPSFQLRVRQLGRVDSQEILYLQSSFSKPKPLACPTAIFRCEDWPIMSGGDPYFGWREFLTGRVETHEIPGDHEVIFREPNVCVFAEKLRACLQTARQPEPRHYEVTLEDRRSLFSRESRA